MPMKNPPHPGHSIRDACLDAVGLSVTEAREGAWPRRCLALIRHTLSRVLNGHTGLSPEMAIRLEKAGWSNADHWLRVQAAYDLAQARRHESRIKVQRYEPRPAA
jgi:antitoxin HigA-1